MEGLKVSSPKEGEMRAILVSLLEAKEWGFNKILVLLNAIEIVWAIKGTSDWSINSVLFDIKATFFFLIS